MPVTGRAAGWEQRCTRALWHSSHIILHHDDCDILTSLKGRGAHVFLQPEARKILLQLPLQVSQLLVCSPGFPTQEAKGVHRVLQPWLGQFYPSCGCRFFRWLPNSGSQGGVWSLGAMAGAKLSKLWPRGHMGAYCFPSQGSNWRAHACLPSQ